VTFVGASSTNSFARFSANGVYVLRLTAGDGQLETSRELTVVVNALASLTTGLQAHWRMDETSGTTAADSSGNARNGAVSGAAWTSGRFSNGLSFDGVDDIVSYTSPVAPQVSFSAWVNTTGNGESTTPRIIATPAYNVRIRRADGAIALEAERATTASEWRSELNSHTDNTWHHVVVTYDSATGATPAIYIDGQPQTVTLVVTGSGAQDPSNGPGFIGNSGGGSRTLLGRLDEVRMYNRVLTATEALALSFGPPTNTAPLVNAGPDRGGSGGGAVSLNGTVSDDGQPGPTVSNLWTVFSGPGAVTFANPQAPTTTATFELPGTYILSLHSSDGSVKVFDQMTVTVVAAPVVSVATTTSPAAEFGPVSGAFTFSRNGGTNVALIVFFTRAGSATSGDYSPLPSQATIPVGAFSAAMTVNPVADTLVEGDETFSVTITTNASYLIGSSPNAVLMIKDRPYDNWRFGHFTSAELGNPAISGDQADPDFDRMRNLLEYALNLNPTGSNNVSGLWGTIESVAGSESFVVRHTRLKNPRDIDYFVEVSTDLATWNSGPAFTQEIDAQDDGNGVTETVRVRILSDPNAPGQRFSRLRVVKQ